MGQLADCGFIETDQVSDGLDQSDSVKSGKHVKIDWSHATRQLDTSAGGSHY